jgi:hypothetical protein
MRVECLALLEASRDARRLVAAWPAIGLIPAKDSDVLTIWSVVSGVGRATVRRLAPVLRHNHVVGIDGEGNAWADPLAVQAVTMAAARALGGDELIRATLTVKPDADKADS